MMSSLSFIVVIGAGHACTHIVIHDDYTTMSSSMMHARRPLLSGPSALHVRQRAALNVDAVCAVKMAPPKRLLLRLLMMAKAIKADAA